MGRPSVLTEPMKVEIGRRLAGGETLRGLSKAMGIAYTTLRRNFSDQVPQIREVAHTLARAEIQLAQLPVSAQRAARTLADQLKEVQENVATSAAINSRTATILSQKAAGVASRLGDDFSEGSEDREKVKTINALMGTANEALRPALALVAANKGQDHKQAKTLEDILEEANRIHEGRTA